LLTSFDYGLGAKQVNREITCRPEIGEQGIAKIKQHQLRVETLPRFIQLDKAKKTGIVGQPACGFQDRLGTVEHELQAPPLLQQNHFLVGFPALPGYLALAGCIRKAAIAGKIDGPAAVW
jgi:hypothetical protein